MAGPIKPDMDLGRQVTRLTLKQIRKILLEEGMGKFKESVILKLASTVLPRINEHSGEDGKAIIIQVASEIKDKNSNETSRKPISNS